MWLGARVSASVALAVVGLVSNGSHAAGDARSPAARRVADALDAFLPQDAVDVRLADYVAWLSGQSGVAIEPVWKSDHREGLDPDAVVTLKGDPLPAIVLLERALEQAGGDGTWQRTAHGTIEVGPRSVLNSHRRIEVYDVSGLLLALPLYDTAPQIDLNSVLQSSGTRGSPFTMPSRSRREEDRAVVQQERARELIELILAFVEPAQWVDGGGDVPRPHDVGGRIIVDAPDYMHRAIGGVQATRTARRYRP